MDDAGPAQSRGDRGQGCREGRQDLWRGVRRRISAAVPLPEHGVITVFVTLPNTKIEFIQPLGEASPIAKFLERNADGGIHHICYDVPDIIAARDTLIREGRAGAR